MGERVNRNEIADRFGVSLPTIDRWIKWGMPVVQRGHQGVAWTFDLADCIRWYGDRRASDAAGDEACAVEEIERRTAYAKMELAELDLAKRKGEVAEISEFERAQNRAFAEIRANVMNVTRRVVTQLLGCTDEAEFKSKLDAELRLALESAASTNLTLDDEDEVEE